TMNEEPPKSPSSGVEPKEGDAEQSTEKRNSEAESTSEVASTQEAMAPSLEPDKKEDAFTDSVELASGEASEGAKALAGEPPMDWFEPLEDDDEAESWDLADADQHFNGKKDPEEESLAGESEKSGSVASGERTFKKIYQRKRSHPDEGWVDWPALGEGWRRKEVVRRSGSSVGQKDVYYLSPQGDRVRSRVELASVLEGILDLSFFEYKTGKFYNGDAPLPRGVRNRGKVWTRLITWIPCGQCVACHNTVNCGQCANCKHGLQSPESRKRICRKRKCICPIRKAPSYKNSDTEDFSVNVDVDDEDDLSTDDDDDKRKRRSCGKCKACLCRKDCGTCDFCIDKPKFGGSNKKRQKCRLRQCQRQAMRHLLPFQLGQAEYGTPDGMMPVGRPRPHYTYSRKTFSKKSRAPPLGLEFSDEEDDSSLNAVSFLTKKMSFQSFYMTFLPFLADNPVGTGVDTENQLLKLLEALRSSALPILWYAIVVEGPQLQLIQCAKQSSMTDTMVLIDPGFCYQVTVQKQPLLLTHPLYDDHPTHLTSVTEVVNLLLDLERYMVCQGLPPQDLSANKGPIILERASTCDFLVKKNVSICINCRALCGQ
uniref:Methyl-CpG binding domain protein 1b n=1 Tax=Myripristis murdjan TaxID=586833 RepID=A0A667Y0F8_9TELE